MDFQGELQDLLDTPSWIERGTRVLEDDLNLFLEGLWPLSRLFTDILAPEADLPRSGAVHAHDGVGHRALTRTRFPDQPQHFSLWNREIDAVDCLNRAAAGEEVLFQVLGD